MHVNACMYIQHRSDTYVYVYVYLYVYIAKVWNCPNNCNGKFQILFCGLSEKKVIRTARKNCKTILASCFMLQSLPCCPPNLPAEHHGQNSPPSSASSTDRPLPPSNTCLHHICMASISHEVLHLQYPSQTNYRGLGCSGASRPRAAAHWCNPRCHGHNKGTYPCGMLWPCVTAWMAPMCCTLTMV